MAASRTAYYYYSTFDDGPAYIRYAYTEVGRRTNARYPARTLLPLDYLPGLVLRHEGLLHEIIEGRMRGKPTRGRRRIQMLHGLANDDGYVALKRAAEDRER